MIREPLLKGDHLPGDTLKGALKIQGAHYDKGEPISIRGDILRGAKGPRDRGHRDKGHKGPGAKGTGGRAPETKEAREQESKRHRETGGTGDRRKTTKKISRGQLGR